MITSLVLSFIAWYFYWGSSRLMALKEEGIDGREAFNSKRFGYHLILRRVGFFQDSFFSSQGAGGL